MSTYADKIHELEQEIRRTKINKATEGHVGRLKAKIAKLKRLQQEKVFGSSSGGGIGYDVKKSGDSSVTLIGLPSVGKSTLLNQLCGKQISEVGSYAFTTLDAIPGTMHYNGAIIQIIDLPGIISGASMGKGKGKRVLGVARSADLILILLDVNNIEKQRELIETELFHVGIRVNQKPPDIVIEKTKSGGLGIATLKKLTNIEESTIKAVMHEYRIINANVTIRSDITLDQLIDTLEGNRVYINAIYVINKIDLIPLEERNNILMKYNAIGISAENNININLLKKEIFDKLDLIKIYLKPQGGETDYDEPLIMRKGVDVGDVCDKLHRNFRSEFRFARIWGTSVKHPGQRVSINHVLHDNDVLTIIRSGR